VAKLLLVEDDPRLAKPLARTLQAQGYRVFVTGRGDEAVRLAQAEQPEVILLDITLDPPSFDGLAVCRELRRLRVDAGIIMLTVSETEMDKVAGLEAGADDYVTKPFRLAELLARVRAQLRRRQPPEVFQFGDVEVDFGRRRVMRAKAAIELTTAEFEILYLLVRHRGHIVTRDQLLREALNYRNGAASRTVDTHLLNLRKKLEHDPEAPIYLLTAHREGYLFAAES
jgi:DNA-binding response OmpR family regulator